jgi:transcriptional regulator with XRE-family HTH domain
MKTPNVHERALCHNLRRLVRADPRSQPVVAARLGVGFPLLRAWLEMRSTPRLPQLLAIRQEFGVTLDELVAMPPGEAG